MLSRVSAVRRGELSAVSRKLARSSGRGGGYSASGVTGRAGGSDCDKLVGSAESSVKGRVMSFSALFLFAFRVPREFEMLQYIAMRNVIEANATTMLSIISAVIGIILRRGRMRFIVFEIRVATDQTTEKCGCEEQRE
jgi:hypothetical protein